jgi:hypothetical protein
MKYTLISAAAASALLGVAAQATPISAPADSIEATASTALQKVEWYDYDWRDRYWRRHHYWGDRYWRHRYWRHRYDWDR